MRRSRPRSPERLAAVPTPRLGPKQLVLRATRRVGGEPGADAIDRPPVHQMPVPRHQEDSQALRDQPQASPAADGAPRTRGSLPQTINQPSGPGPPPQLHLIQGPNLSKEWGPPQAIGTQTTSRSSSTSTAADYGFTHEDPGWTPNDSHCWSAV
jgi:hypothetical protein